ncbi:hypothetical protein HN51_045138 [Arachis hypogaea]
MFNIYPRKGAILLGSDADIIILNPNSSFKISTNHTTPDLTQMCTTERKERHFFFGKVEVTISRGRVVWKNNELKVTRVLTDTYQCNLIAISLMDWTRKMPHI